MPQIFAVKSRVATCRFYKLEHLSHVTFLTQNQSDLKHFIPFLLPLLTFCSHHLQAQSTSLPYTNNSYAFSTFFSENNQEGMENVRGKSSTNTRNKIVN